MSSYSDKNIVRLALELLQDVALLSASEIESDRLTVKAIASDGSTRRFWRVAVSGKNICIAAAPLATTENELKESRSAWAIGKHLHQRGCAVPEIFGWHEDSGLLIFEDLGNERLHGKVAGEDDVVSKECLVKDCYLDVLSKLVHMQVEGAVGFDPSWCWDGGHYSKELMLKRESGYFLQAFWKDMLQQSTPEGILLECEHVAELAAKAPAGYFLHRDFQSRNIMLAGGVPRFIDFQGGRLGPLAYDLASLLIDPYTALDYRLQEELEDAYIQELSKHIELDSTVFRKEFQVLALQRNLQIIGAFSFLSQVRGKSFFAGYIKPALQTAKYRLEQPLFKDVPLLTKMIDQGLQLL